MNLDYKIEKFLVDLGSIGSTIGMIRGAAGTGKTTVLKCCAIKYSNIYYVAPTGRASMVLSKSVQQECSTIHHLIYTYDEAASYKSQTQEIFMMQPNQYPAGALFVVDEASMISNRSRKDGSLRFGSGNLLFDLLSFVDFSRGQKLLFSGDPAQLPPVDEVRSSALDPAFFKEEYGMECLVLELNKVYRQDANSYLLEQVVPLRENILNEFPISLELKDKEGEVENIDFHEVVSQYLTHYQQNLSEVVVLAYSNRKVFDYNQQIVTSMGYDYKNLFVGLKLVQMQNMVLDGVAIYNGDSLLVRNVLSSSISLSGFYNDDQNRRHPVGPFHFQKVKVETEQNKNLIGWVWLDYYRIDKPCLDPQVMKHVASVLEQNRDHPEAIDIKRVLKVKMGYAITCHKAQGGEWKNVFVDFEGISLLNSMGARWCYTALTRTRKYVGVVDLPTVTKRSRLNIAPITRIKGAGIKKNGFLDLSTCSNNMEDAFRRLITASVMCPNLEIEYKQYCNRVVFEEDGKCATFDFIYNGMLHFRKPVIVKHTDVDFANLILTQLLSLEKGESQECDIESEIVLLDLWQQEMIRWIQTLLSAFEQSIGEIELKESGYYINLYLCKDSKGIERSLKLYFNGKNQFTQIVPSSTLGNTDTMLVNLLKTIKS
ncbi:AAA family ATPase [Halosquirtibacter laminarini]|uniref:AAA family ATPase n=1 Tax=Halosquirtibacter laminarini TaxID=3374600 RepID=A0AC61NPX3_9BACT|nr:AAA family ATPase [Prolixibacteraceae bacterium]